ASSGTDQSRARTTPSALRAVALSALAASAAYRPGRYNGELTIFEPESRDLGVPPSGLLWSRHAAALRKETPKGRHDDMLIGANPQAVADLMTRCLESAALAGAEDWPFTRSRILRTQHRLGAFHPRPPQQLC